MPFTSRAQQRFMFAAEARGELPEGTARRWAHETKDIKKLPERVRKQREAGAKDALKKFGLDLSWAQPAIEWTVNNAPQLPDMARQVIQEHPLLSTAATGAAGWQGGRAFQATKDTGANIARGLARGGAAVGQGIHGAGQSLAGLFRKRALDEHTVYSGPPAFAPPEPATTVPTEAGKQREDKAHDP